MLLRLLPGGLQRFDSASLVCVLEHEPLLRDRQHGEEAVESFGRCGQQFAEQAPIVAGAGGIMTTWEGGDVAGGGRIIAAGDARVYEEAKRLLTA